MLGQTDVGKPPGRNYPADMADATSTEMQATSVTIELLLTMKQRAAPQSVLVGVETDAAAMEISMKDS